jgi:transcriptional regulator with XRE-family HTH domain
VLQVSTTGPLGEYLRARRELLDPTAVGMRVVGVRRTPGLRREELAMLAGISNDYYLRLEQGRDRNPSRQVVEALARALRLDEAGTAYLLGMSNDAKRPARRAGAHKRDVVPVGIRELLATIAVPAFVEDRRFDILATNSLATALDPSIETGANRLRTVFLDDRAALLWGDQQRTRRDIVAAFRASIGTELDDPRTQLLVGELSLISEEFRRLWARHDVAVLAGGPARLDHPLIGPIDLRRQKFPIGGTDGLLLAMYHPAPGTAAAAAMARLAQTLGDTPAMPGEQESRSR